jgi:hypothetical protein
MTDPEENANKMMKIIEKIMEEGFELRSRIKDLNESEKKRFDRICHLLLRTKDYYGGSWVTLDKQKYHIYKFYLFKPDPERNYKIAGYLEPYGLYNPDVKTVDTSAAAPVLPDQKDWPWG